MPGLDSHLEKWAQRELAKESQQSAVAGESMFTAYLCCWLPTRFLNRPGACRQLQQLRWGGSQEGNTVPPRDRRTELFRGCVLPTPKAMHLPVLVAIRSLLEMRTLRSA